MAKTTGVLSGNAVMVYRDDVAIGCTTGATFNGTNNEIETTCKDNDGAITKTPGSQDWSITVQGNSKFDAAEGLSEMLMLYKTKEEVTVRYGTTNTDDPYMEGQAFVSSISVDGPVNAPSTWNVTFSPKGPIYLFNT